MNELLDSVNAYHVRVCLQWHARVDELEARVKQLSAENVELRAQLKQQQHCHDQRVVRGDASASTTATAAALTMPSSTADSTTLGDLMDRMMEPVKAEPAVEAEPVVLVVDSQSAGADVLSPPRRHSSASKPKPIDVSDDFARVPSSSNKRRHVPAPADVVEIVDDESHVPSKLARTRTTTAASAEKPFRYIEPVLNRAERRKLIGRECEQCSEFYDAVCAAGGRTLDRDAFVQEHSRHREVCTPPPATPPGFWAVDFEETAVRSDATTQSPS
jgi:hypothetical protein